MAEPMEWGLKAACRDADVGLFFVAPGDSAEPARAWCKVCKSARSAKHASTTPSATTNTAYGAANPQSAHLNAGKKAS